MKKQLINSMILGMVILTVISCGKKKDFETTPTGLKYKFFTQNEKGLKPRLGDFIVVHMVGLTSKDSAFFDTYRDKKPFTISVIEPTFKGALEEGFMMMAEGDSASFVVSADSLFLRTFQTPLPDFIEKGSNMTFTIKMVDIMTQDEMQKKMDKEGEEMKNLEKDILKNFKSSYPTKLEETPDGLLYEVLTKNEKGAQAVDGDTVEIHYTGTLLDGTKFDSSLDRGEPISFPVGKQMVIDGWEKALKMMHVGEKYKVIIPSWMAYGPRGRGDVIKPYSTLVFEMELLKIKKP